MADPYDGLTPTQLAHLRDAVGQSGLQDGLRVQGGAWIGATGAPAWPGSLMLEGSIRRSQALGAGVTRTSLQSIGNSANQAIEWSVARWDSDGCWNAASPTRLTCRTSGIYVVSAALRYEPNPNGQRWARLLLNGTGYLADTVAQAPAGVTGSGHNPVAVCALSEGDFIELLAYQNSGVSLNVIVGVSFAPELAMVRVA